EIKAVAYDKSGRAAATVAKHTAGPAVALRLTPITGPDGWRADGADVALLDVEAVDVRGERVPTFQQRVDFAVEGPAIWRGGYNSGKIDSINHTFLDLEAGINRVALRSTDSTGPVKVRATSVGLTDASISLAPRAVSADEPPAWPKFPLPATPQRQPAELAPRADAVAAIPAGQAGRFIKNFNYTGPNAAIVHVETNAQNGRNAYVDVESPFKTLPASLVGADWVQVANGDARYHAVDLMELATATPAVVTIAHDDRLPRPPWLERDFASSGEKIVVNGVPLSLFTRRLDATGSLTFGPNTEQTNPKQAAMYLVFVNEK
ncbi:MAG TPA: hypothetical protein VK477_07410, partial [Acidobacteriota bacterium]|nr:hypothetical protein [Acidobacteriota bacterium]